MKGLSALFALAVQAAGGAAASQPLALDAAVLRIESGTTIRPCMECQEQEVRLRVTVLEGAKVVLTRADKPQVLRVSTNGARVYNPEWAIDANWDPPTGEPQTLVLTISPPVLSPATYDVVLSLLPASRPRAPSQTIQLIVAAATLQGPEKLLIQRTVYAPLWSNVRATPLVVTETGRAVPVRDLRLRSQSFAQQNEPIDGGIVQDGSTMPAVIAPGGSGEVPYRINNFFPLGLSSGKVLLTAPELSAQLAIPVEVRNEISLFYLALAIVVGLICSYFVKVHLHHRLQLYQERVVAGTLLQDVEKDRKSFPDRTFQSKTERPLRDLQGVINGAERPAIERARKLLDEAWQAARKDLEGRRTAFRTSLDAWHKIVTVDWDVPPAVSPVLRQARDAVTQSSSLDQNGDVEAATTWLSNASASTITKGHDAGRQWQRASRRFFDALVNAQAGIYEGLLAALKARSDAWRLAYPELQPAAAADVELHPLLRQIMGEHVTAREHLQELSSQLDSEFEAARVKLLRDGAPEAAIRAIHDALATAIAVLKKGADEPGAAIDLLPNALAELQQAWEKGFAATRSGISAEIQALLEARDYRAAAALLGLTTLNFATSADGTVSLPVTVIEQLRGRIATVRGARPGVLVRGKLTPANPAAALVHASEEQIRQTKRLQTFIVGGLFFIWAMSTASATFDGTVRGVLVAMFSAFSLDVGVDTLLSRIKGTVFS